MRIELTATYDTDHPDELVALAAALRVVNYIDDIDKMDAASAFMELFGYQMTDGLANENSPQMHRVAAEYLRTVDRSARIVDAK